MMQTILIHPRSNEQAQVFEDLAKIMNLPFEKMEEKKHYNPEFVAKIEQGRKDKKMGLGRFVTAKDFEL